MASVNTNKIKLGNELNFSSIEEIDEVRSRLFKTFETAKTKDLKWRKWQLKQLYWLIYDNGELLCQALQKDLGRSKFESLFSDVTSLQNQILEIIDNLETYVKDQKPEEFDPLNLIANTTIKTEPLGVSLVIGSWNFPVSLLLLPVAYAIAAGCCVVLKPSDVAVHTQNVVADLVPKYLDQSALAVIKAGPKEMEYILKTKFDHIFYTGSTGVGKIIAAAAAKNLTPSTLELGGQTPAIVTASADIDAAAQKIAWGKFLNAGQVCIAANHVFVDPSVKNKFVERLKYHFDVGGEFSKPENSRTPKSRVINKRNFDRLLGLLKNSKGKIEIGGESNPDKFYIDPTVVTDVDVDDSLMSEELFGPILPVIEATEKQALEHMNKIGRPLAVYLFSNDKEQRERIEKYTHTGAVVHNDIIMHYVAKGSPFGGVGESGWGSYHGKYGVQAFSYLRPVVTMPGFANRILQFRYAPFLDQKASKIPNKKAKFSRNETALSQTIKSQPGFLLRILRLGGFSAFGGYLRWFILLVSVYALRPDIYVSLIGQLIQSFSR